MTVKRESEKVRNKKRYKKDRSACLCVFVVVVFFVVVLSCRVRCNSNCKSLCLMSDSDSRRPVARSSSVGKIHENQAVASATGSSATTGASPSD